MYLWLVERIFLISRRKNLASKKKEGEEADLSCRLHACSAGRNGTNLRKNINVNNCS